MKRTTNLKSLQEALGDNPKLVEDLVRGGAHDELRDDSSRDLGVGEAAHEVDLLASDNNSGPGRVLDSVLGLAVLSDDAPDGAPGVVALERLDVLHLEGLEEQVVHSQQGHGVLHRESQKERSDVLPGLVEVAGGLLGVGASADFNAPLSRVHANLNLQLFHERLDKLNPSVLERRDSVRGNVNAADLDELARFLVPLAHSLGCCQGGCRIASTGLKSAVFGIAKRVAVLERLLVRNSRHSENFKGQNNYTKK